MIQPSEMDVLRQLAFAEGIDPGRLFISDGVVYRMTGEDVTGTVCAVDTPFWREAVAACILKTTGELPMSNKEWIAHAYPLQQVTIKLQGTRHSDKAAIVGQLETVLARLKAGDTSGQDHDDDFGYAFEYVQAVPGPSFFDDPAGSA